jgi:eukaryotic-like serine/threonine-protein kinase
MDIEWLGPYQIVGRLGRGGMGIVYEGVHRETGDTAAVKLLSAALAQEEGFRVRFEAEIETLRKLNHPNIVRLFGFGEQDGHLYYSMELVDGNSLEEELRRGRRFDWREAARIGIETCRALRHAHDRGIIHRDIKPGNLLLGNDGRIKLSDFGIAKLYGNSRLTSAGNVVGTAEYMPPEQAEGLPVDARSDLYSLGTLLYALLARRPVFRGKSLPEVLHKQRFEQPDPLRKYAPDAPVELERILAQLLEKNPQLRIPNADLLGRRLEALLQALPGHAETVEAGPEWFKIEEPAATIDQPPPIVLSEEGDTGATLDHLLADDQPKTEPLPAATSRQAAEPAAPAVSPLDRELAEAMAAPEKRGLFIPVAEHELDPMAEEAPQHTSWWQTLALIGTLVVLWLIAWWSLQPPSANSLYKRIQVVMDSTAPLSPYDAEQVQKNIDDFIYQYGNDSRAAEVRTFEKEVEQRALQWTFNSRISGVVNKNELSPVVQMYKEAVGHIPLNPTLAMTKLQAMVDLYSRMDEDEQQPEINMCLKLAEPQLADLRERVQKQAERQIDLLKARLDAADALRKSDPKRAESIYRAVVELYGDKPWAAEPVGRAKKEIAKLPAASKP